MTFPNTTFVDKSTVIQADWLNAVNEKCLETATVTNFGAVGDGVVDDTAAIQAAINSGAKEIVFPAGGTYLIDGGLVSNTAGQVFTVYGATIKLKDNATSKGMLRLNGAGSCVFGGTWDGNKSNGNSPVDTYSSWNVAVYGDRCTIKDCYSINTFGMFATGGSVSDTLFKDNTIRNTTNYGIFLSTAVDAYRNRAIGNNIDMSEGGLIGQGILFTRTGSVLQYDWELADNIITGPQGSLGSQAICLAVRGTNGIVSNNLTRYGSMGFSEGGSNTVITGNRFLDLQGTTKYGIEPSGANVVISNNIVTGARRGIIVSGNETYDNLVITGNTITSDDIAIKLQINSGYTGHNITISGNYLKGNGYVINPTRDITGLNITNNIIVGPSSTFASGRGIFLDTPPTDAYVFISGNTIMNVQRPYAIYNTTSDTVNKLYAIGNNLVKAGTNSSSSYWNVEGLAVAGTDVISCNNVNPASIGMELNVLDQSSTLTTQYINSGTPEGGITASPGSICINKSGGAGTTLYIKETGTGNTGWKGLS